MTTFITLLREDMAAYCARFDERAADCACHGLARASEAFAGRGAAAWAAVCLIAVAAAAGGALA